MSTIRVDVRGIEQLRKIFLEVADKRQRSLSSRAINKAGRDQRVATRRQIQTYLPVKAKVLANRVKWHPLSRDHSQGGVLRVLGRGKFKGSGEIKPRDLKLKYPTTSVRRSPIAGSRANARLARKSRVSYGVGGDVPQRTVLRGFVVNVGRGNRWVPSYRSDFDPRRATLFQRKTRDRASVVKVDGITAGTVATSHGLHERAAAEMGERAVVELRRLMELEMEKHAR